MARTLPIAVLLLASCVGPTARGQEKKDDKPAAPRVTAVVPLAVEAGATSKVRLRGFKLDAAKDVKVVGPAELKDQIKFTIKSRGKIESKDDKAKAAGDTHAELELELPKDAAETLAEVKFVVIVTPDGQTPERSVRVVHKSVLVDEQEPNGGLRTAQAVAANPAVVRGVIGEEKDVDVYRVAGKAGQTLRAEVCADRAGGGSSLDGSLTLFDARGRTLAFADDSAGGKDPTLELKLPADGDYFVALIDAHDRGGATAYPYLLELSVK